MFGRPRGFSGSRLACLGLAASMTVLMVLGCGGEPAPPSNAPEGGHAKQVTKNMEDFMKGNPYKNTAKEQPQMK